MPPRIFSLSTHLPIVHYKKGETMPSLLKGCDSEDCAVKIGGMTSLPKEQRDLYAHALTIIRKLDQRMIDIVERMDSHMESEEKWRAEADPAIKTVLDMTKFSRWSVAIIVGTCSVIAFGAEFFTHIMSVIRAKL